MPSRSASPSRRVMLIVATAVLFPTVILIGWLFREFALQRMESLEASSQQAADLIVLLADTRAETDVTALRVLSTAQFFAAGDLVGASKRAEDVLNLIEGWNAVILTDTTTGQVYFTATPEGATMGGTEITKSAGSDLRNGFGGVQRDGIWCPCLTLTISVPDRPYLVLTAFIDPAVYQGMLMKNLPPDAVVAFVDQHGNFIARSVDIENRVGTPATQFVRDAVARGGRGIYKGTTFEGLENYSAYSTSDMTGWSAHVAINDKLIDGPRAMATGGILVAALAAILIGGILYTYLSREIAARQLEDRRLMEFQKAEALREFTATVIHDFRNITSAVQSGLSLILRNTKEQKTKEYAIMVGDVMERGTRLTNRLLNFVREDTDQMRTINLQDFLAGMDYLLKQAAGQGVQLQIATPTSPVKLLANQDQLELAMVNLVVNARDAMNGEGKIDIRVNADARYVQICVADTGPGIPHEMRQKVFNRFFTTKPLGSGTGLGLSQVAEMVREANGKVLIEDADGGGAKFVLRFKRMEADLDVTETAMSA